MAHCSRPRWTAPDLLGKTYPDAQPIRMIREGLSGTSQITREPKWWQPSESQSRIISSRQVDGFPVLVSVTIGDKTFLGQWRERVYFILTLATLLSAVAVLVTAQILRLSARNEAAARLASERRLLAALIDTPAALCAVLDQQGRVIYCNDRFRQLIARDDGTATSCATRPCMAPPPSSPSPPATTPAASRSISRSSGPVKPRTLSISPFRIGRCRRSASARS